MSTAFNLRVYNNSLRLFHPHKLIFQIIAQPAHNLSTFVLFDFRPQTGAVYSHVGAGYQKVRELIRI